MQAQLEACAVALDNFTATRQQPYLDEFRTKLDQLLISTDLKSNDLLQPYSQQVINELSLSDLLPPKFQIRIKDAATSSAFDSAGLATSLRKIGADVTNKINHINQLDTSLGALEVEYQIVEDDSAEIGFLLPRELVGDTLPELAKEFEKLSKLARAINELSGEDNYDPKIATISSSWWQIFLDIKPDQVLIWVLAIERIVSLFKSNLEIKHLQQQLSEKNISSKITDLISKEIEKSVTAELKQISSDIRKKFTKIEDKSRANEVEIQLGQGLFYLANRLNKGAQIEINVGIPDDPKEPKVEDGEDANTELLASNKLLRERITKLREIRLLAQSASEQTKEIDSSSPLLIEVSSATVEGDSKI